MYLKILNNFLAKFDPKFWIHLVCLWSCLLFTACTAHFVKNDFSYNRLIGKYTKNHKHYKGLYNVFQIHATILNTSIQEAVWEKQKNKLQWNRATAERNKREALEQIHSQSQFLLAFYTPDVKQNYLNKEKSLWKIYLDFDGQRYKGKSKKRNNSFIFASRVVSASLSLDKSLQGYL